MRAEAQIADELARALAGPVLGLLGIDLGEEVARRCRVIAPVLAFRLEHEDDRVAAQVAIDLMSVLWPLAAPETLGEAEWWSTPLGRLCARSLSRDDAEVVSHSVAAAILGVHTGTVAQLVSRGTLERHPDGGVCRSSVLARLARLKPPIPGGPVGG